MSQEYFTAVFKVKDREEFMKFARQISGAFADDKWLHGAQVTGCGWGDSMTEADRMREFLDERNYDPEGICRGDHT